ncbi:hypothetical protein [Arcobacter sp. L]|uniref:hypothetical protein n=1 Tax=Arcobacter sp. L TaxID=944547 RepID=UPI0002296477|nr:hypothetical protein [Arcobacter sp. L]BAK73727.1 hypothetical protein ABLL_1852 [Arcobacter sp. L]
MSAIRVKRVNVEDKKMFIVKHGEVGIQVDEEKAEYICRTLALFMGLSIVDQRENIRVLAQKANEKSSKEYPFGGDEYEEYS